MNYERLSDVAQVIMGQSPPSSTYNTIGKGLPFYQGKTDFGDMYPTPRVYCTEPSRIAEAGDILISVRAPVGPTNISRERSAIGRGLSVIRVGKNLDRDFLLYFLRSYEPELAKAGTGSTFAAISREDLETIKIPLLPLPEQKRIASLLARADRLRQLRRTAHDLGDALLQSVFLEMFGDVVRNEKGWEKYQISEYVNVQGGFSFKSEDFIKSGVKVVKITNVHYGHLTWQGDTEFLPVEYLDKYSAFSLKTGDIVMSLTRPIIKSLNSVKVCLVQEVDLPCLLNQRVGRLLIENSNKLIPEYLLHFCYSQHFKSKVDDFLSESLQPNISINQVGEIGIPVPPLSRQEEFARAVRRVESLRGRMSEAGRQVEGLFEALLSESFQW
jgi:type I restriction enzyme S subunit